MKPLFAVKVKVAQLSKVPGTEAAKVTLSFVPNKGQLVQKGLAGAAITAVNLEIWVNGEKALERLELGKILQLEIKPDNP